MHTTGVTMSFPSETEIFGDGVGWLTTPYQVVSGGVPATYNLKPRSPPDRRLLSARRCFWCLTLRDEQYVFG